MPDLNAPEIFKSLGETGLLPLFSQPDKHIALEITRVLHGSGFRALELTHRNANALEVFRHVRSAILAEGLALHLGAGSILNKEDAVTYIEAGAAFIVGPGYVEAVDTACRQRGVPYVPGIFSPSEALAADSAGNRLLKLFPASALGPAYLKALKAPCPRLRIMPTGGVGMDEASIRAWFEAGAICLGAGSELLPKDLIENKDWAALGKRGREALASAARYKPKMSTWSDLWGF
jgi:2-dehydro-3-deoxyphosphogluconate aldolase/(4S)-4-hydroxy-2-oxoglutarate aldolase